MRARMVDYADTSYIDKDVIENGILKLMPATYYQALNPEHLMLWCGKHAIYQVPTIELVDWLKQFKEAIEICAGNACVGNFLGIRCTDNYCQTLPEVLQYYKLLQQVPTSPPDFVERIEANEAIIKYKPKTVIGCFVTQKHIPGEDDGNAYGPMEEDIIKQTTYVHIGNENTHRNKRILKFPHKTYKFPWLVSRAVDQNKNVIWVWENEGN